MQLVSSLLPAAALIAAVAAYPSYVEERQDDAHNYIAPGPNDSRGPCPGLNTLANHGFLPRDGRNISADQLRAAFLDGFGMGASTIRLAITNAFHVCEFVEQASCDTLTNLTLLAEPHTFEHDVSLSRPDYNFNFTDGSFDNNQNFEFSPTWAETAQLSIVKSTHMDYSQANLIRLQRESTALQLDIPEWFLVDRPTMVFELGFIFAVMTDPTLGDDEPQVRNDWFTYWFVNESFPSPLGWKKPDPPRESDFVISASKRVLAAPVTSTPSPLPSGALDTTQSPGTELTNLPASILFPLPSDAPYFATNPPVVKRQATTTSGSPTTNPTLASARLQAVAEVEATAGPLRFQNPYVDEIPVEQLSRRVAAASVFGSNVGAKVMSITAAASTAASATSTSVAASATA